MTEVRTRTRTCDQCGADLTRTNLPYKWHYVLSGNGTPSTSRIGYDPHPKPPDDHHFCNMDCLARWTGHSFGEDVTPEMWMAADDFLAGVDELKDRMSYSQRRKLGVALFKAMWEAHQKVLEESKQR